MLSTVAVTFEMESRWPSRPGAGRRASYIPRRGQPKGRLSISGPIGPVLHNGEPITILEPAKPSTALTYATAYSRAPSYGQLGFSTDENVPPVSPNVAAATLQARVPKSRTFNVLSNITQSFSRGSLTSNPRNREASGGSTTSAVNVPTAATDIQDSQSSLAKLSKLSGSVEIPASIPNNPRLITTAQPSSYWSGRFMALHDRLHGELLCTSNINTVIEAQAARSSFCRPARRLSNNPLTAIYSPARAQRKSLQDCSYISPTKSSGGIPASATSGAVLQTTHNTATLDLTRSLPPLPTDEVGPPPARFTTGPQRDALLARSDKLTDDENRCKRVFVHLESLCITNEARESLYVWQQGYARRSKRPGLLPKGAIMDEPRGFLSRMFSGRKERPNKGADDDRSGDDDDAKKAGKRASFF